MRALPLALSCLAAFGLALTSAPGVSHAYEGRATLGLDLGYGLVAITDTDLPQHGVVAGISGGIGLGDQFAVNARAAYALHPSDADLLHVGILGVEGVYLVDIVQIVPFFGVGLDGLVTGYQGTAGLELGLHAVVGADYLLSREWIIGLDIRPYFLPVTVAEGRLEPVYVVANLRLSYLFEL